MTRWRATIGAVITIVLVVATGCGNPPAVPVAARPAPPALDRSRLDHTSLLLRGRLVDEAEWQRWTTRTGPLEQIVDEMLADPFLARDIAPALIFRNNLMRAARTVGMDGYDLVISEVRGTPVFHLGKACKLEDTVLIKPWWDPAHPVRACKQVVRETVWELALPDGTVQTCNLKLSTPKRLPGTPCGCGPNLVRCVPPEYVATLTTQVSEELRATTAYVASADQPLAQLFTMNETWRRRDVELFYLRELVNSKQIANPEPLFEAAMSWPADGKLASRAEAAPGQHAGVLTAPQIMYHVFDLRQRMRIIYESMWCSGESAPGARPEDLLSLRAPTLSTLNEGWRELAGRPICTSCHARLDYGMQFFLGYRAPDGIAYHYVASASPGERGPLYAADINDPRGTAELTPHGFAELATRQPEFARCMARDVAEYVFGARTSPETVDRLARSAQPTELRLRALMRLAILEFLHCDDCRSPGGELAAPATPRPPAAAPGLPRLLGDHCTTCHDADASMGNFEQRLDRPTQLRVMDQALFGRMPPGEPLPAEARRAFVAAVLGADPIGSVRQSPQTLVLGHADPPSTLPLLVARQYLRGLASGHAGLNDLNTLEMALAGRDSVLTPDQIALTAVEASRSCRSLEPARRAACIQAALDGIWGPVEPTPRAP